MSFARPTKTEIIDRCTADMNQLPGADARLRRSPLNVVARTVAGASHGLHGRLDALSKFLPDAANSAWLVRWCSMFGLTRKASVAAIGTVTASGTNGTAVLAGAALVRADGARYLVTANAVIAGGVAPLSVRAEGAGIAGSMDPGQSLTFQSPIAGVQAIATVAAGGIVGGADQEDIEEIRARLLLRMRNPIRGGAASDYIQWANEVAEVTRAWVYENWNGLGTVKLVFVMDGRADIIPESGDVAAVAAYIADRRPVCADVTVVAPTADPLNFTITLTPASDEVKAAVEAELRDLIAREAEPGGTLLISHINESVSIAAGETDHVVTSPSGNVTTPAGHISTLGTITWA